MANTMFGATYLAWQEITKTFDMVWALDAGLWNLRKAAKKYYDEHPNTTEKEAKNSLVEGLTIHGLNPKRISTELSWEYEEQYIAKLLLINATAIFDAWVDEFVEATISQKALQQIIYVRKTFQKPYTLGDKVKADFKAGLFKSYTKQLKLEQISALSGCFHFTADRQDAYIENLRLIYKYFKSCRNCCAHGDVNFTEATERNYNAIKTFSKADCGLKEFPKIEPTVQGNPFKIYLRGVVGLYDVLIRIINHFDLLAADYMAVENELVKRWTQIPKIQLSTVGQKRNRSIRNYIKSVNMCPPYVNKTEDVYLFLKNKNLIK